MTPLLEHMAIAAACKRAKMQRVNPHRLRHSFVSLLRFMGCELATCGRLVGHGKRTITERYSHSEWRGWEYWTVELSEHVLLGKSLGKTHRSGGPNG